MKAHIEWTMGIVRAGVDFKEYGDKYEFACTVYKSGDHIKIMGAAGEFNRNIWRAINNECKNYGIKTVEFDRIKSEKTKVMDVI